MDTELNGFIVHLFILNFMKIHHVVFDISSPQEKFDFFLSLDSLISLEQEL